MLNENNNSSDSWIDKKRHNEMSEYFQIPELQKQM